MDKLRTKLEELLKAVKASKKKLPAVPETHIEPTEHPSSIPKRDLPKILKQEKSTTPGIWPEPSGGVQDHPKLPRLDADDGKEAINTYGKGTSSDKPSMASGQPRIHHVKLPKKSKTKLAKNGQWTLE